MTTTDDIRHAEVLAAMQKALDDASSLGLTGLEIQAHVFIAAWQTLNRGPIESQEPAPDAPAEPAEAAE